MAMSLYRILLKTVTVLTGLLLATTVPAGAEPYLAARTGFKCGQCHVNPSGGGKRTDFGSIYAHSNLYMRMLTGTDGTPVVYSGRIDNSLALGADYRLDETVLLSYRSSEGEALERTHNTVVSEANLYVEVDLVPGKVLLYLDQTLSPVSSSREFFAMFSQLPYSTYVKIGQMLLPYGLRIRDNDAFIRNRTGYTFNSQAAGVELGLSKDKLDVVCNLTDDRVSLAGAIVTPRFRLGASYGRLNPDDNTFGPFAAARVGNAAVLGEVDFIQIGGVNKVAYLGEVNYLLVRGLNVKATYEFFDRNTDVANDHDGQERVTFAAEPFITQFIQVSAAYRVNRFIPQNAVDNQDEFLMQFHIFF